MKKRIVTLLLVTMLVLTFGGTVTAEVLQPRADAGLSGDVYLNNNGTHSIIGRISGVSNDYLTIRAVLRRGNTIYGSAYNEGQGPQVTALKDLGIVLPAGTYQLYLYGTTPSHNPSVIITVTI